MDARIITLNNEGLRISTIGRVLKIPKTTIVKKILNLASKVTRPILTEGGQSYEVDEFHTLKGKNDSSHYTYIMYAINRTTKKIVDF
jgi:insertion element IS1 protein InsB